MKCLIIGGVAGGATTAARLRRMDEDAQIVIFEKGPYISYANCGLPYYIGGVISERNALFLQTPTSFGNRFDADVRVSTEVTSIDKVQKKVTCVNLKTGKTYEESYDKLVLAPGTTAVKPPIPGIDAANIFTLRDVNDTDAIRTYLDSLPKPARVVVVGAGFIGMEMSENFRHAGCEVTIVEKASQILPPVDWEVAAEVQQEVTRNGVRLIVNDSVSAFVQNGNATQIQLLSGEMLETDMVLVSVGVKPLTTLAVSAGLELGELGGIKVNEYMQTFVDTIRGLGGKNAKRCLMITGYAASSSKNNLAAIKLPEDDHLIVSVHAYIPYNFALNKEGTSTWNNDTRDIDELMKNLDELFISKGIPVIIGEFGAMNKENLEERISWVKYYISAAKKVGTVCVWWDNHSFRGNGENFGLLHCNGMNITWKYPELVTAMVEESRK